MKMAGENKKLTIKVLSQEIVNLKMQVEEFQFLKEEFINLQNVVNKLLGKDKTDKEEYVNPVSETTAKDEKEKAVNCNLCDLNLDSKKSMKMHIKRNHPRKVKCDECSKTFESNVDLEIHMNLHRKPKMFKCDICEKTFHLKWRLTKHISGHGTKMKFCHYFNNQVKCPFEENGCMFTHSASPQCIFKESCQNSLCQ